MTRNLKNLGLALVAMFAMSAVASSAAQAQLTVTPEKYPAVLTFDSIGTQQYTFPGGSKFGCNIFGGHMTIKEKGVGDTSVTATNLSYSGCTVVLPSGAEAFTTVDMEGCHYLFHGGKEDVANHFTEGEIDLTCPGTGPVWTVFTSQKADEEGKAPICRLTWQTFTNHKGITYTNTATTTGPPHVPNDFDIKMSFESPFTRDGILCPMAGTAIYEGEITVTGFEDLPGNVEGARIGVTISTGK